VCVCVCAGSTHTAHNGDYHLNTVHKKAKCRYVRWCS